MHAATAKPAEGTATGMTAAFRRCRVAGMPAIAEQLDQIRATSPSQVADEKSRCIGSRPAPPRPAGCARPPQSLRKLRDGSPVTFAVVTVRFTRKGQGVMGLRFRVGFGPFSYSTSLSGDKRKAAARRRASTKAKQKRVASRQQRTSAREHARQLKAYNSPDAVAARAAAKADIAARTRRGKVTACDVDALRGGRITLADAEGGELVLIADAARAVDFLSLKKGDICEIVLTHDGGAAEYFSHLYRTNGAEPRNPSGQRVTRDHPLPLAGAPAGASRAAPPTAPGGSLRHLQIVGESHYQRELWALIGIDPARFSGAEIRREGIAELVPEPTNQYDPNAVKVTINGVTVGYVEAEDAAQYRPSGRARATVYGRRLEDGTFSRLGVFLE
jgi:HIRAN domain